MTDEKDGRDWNAWLEEWEKVVEADEQELLEEAKRKAKRDGKEPFDVAVLSGIMGRAIPPEDVDEWEKKYYLQWSRVRTMQELRRAMEEAEVYDGGDMNVEARQEIDERLAKAKAAARGAGKEPFDMDAFHQLFPERDLTRGKFMKLHPTDWRSWPSDLQRDLLRDWEIAYYLHYPDAMTLRQFGEALPAADADQ